MTPNKTRELVRVYDAAETLFVEVLQDGSWHAVDELRELISAELALARYRATPGWIAAGLITIIETVQKKLGSR